MKMNLFAFLLASILWSGCQKPPPPSTGQDSLGHDHTHEPPHGGTVVALGGEEFHLEFVLDAGTNRIQAFVLDGHMHEFVRIPAPEFEVLAKLPGTNATLTFKAVTKSETGETVGNTALFEATADWLRTNRTFDAELKDLVIGGKQYTSVPFHFPNGNENTGHQH